MNIIRFLSEKLRLKRPNTDFPLITNNPSITTGSERFRAYPSKTFLGEQGVFAYYFLATLDHADLPVLETLIKKQFPGQMVANDSTIRNSNQEALAISYRNEFGGLLVEATTNSIPLLQSIDHLFKAPKAPWVAFPDMKPIEAALPKQGSLEFWWNHIWLPFWLNCTESERNQFLRSATDDWREALS